MKHKHYYNGTWMKKYFLLYLLLVLSSHVLDAQEPTDSIFLRPKNNVNLEALGSASLVSLNYDRLFVVNQNLMLSSKIGVGFNQALTFCIGDCDKKIGLLTVPHHLTINIGKRYHFLELGVGGTLFTGYHLAQQYVLYPLIGYRGTPLKSGKGNFRIFALIPFSSENNNSHLFLNKDNVLILPFGLSFGLSF